MKKKFILIIIIILFIIAEVFVSFIFDCEKRKQK